MPLGRRHFCFALVEAMSFGGLCLPGDMRACLATVYRDCDCQAYRMGGAADHVHIAARLARTLSQTELLEKIKKTSSVNGFIARQLTGGLKGGRAQGVKLVQRAQSAQPNPRR